LAIFSRRTLQRLLDENAAFMRAAQLATHVSALNRNNAQSLDFEWEVVVLNALHRRGLVSYEPTLPGSSRPDVLFGLTSADHGGAEFLAEIATVSDQGRHEANPLEAYRIEVLRRLRKAQLKAGNFTLRVNGEVEGKKNRRGARLHLPPVRDMATVFDSEFERFLSSCRAQPSDKREFVRLQPGIVNLVISYDPAQLYFSCSYMSYRVAYSLTKNPIHNVLTRKAEQLKAASHPLASGVILCSADCDLRPGSLQPGSLRPGRIITHFLEERSSVSFVLALDVLPTKSRPSNDSFRHSVQSWLYVNPNARYKLGAAAIQALIGLHELMPPPVAPGARALGHLRGPARKEGLSFYGGGSVGGTTIRISARVLLDLLSGAGNREDLLKAYGMPGAPWGAFDRMRRRGMTIESAIVESNADEDDDWITFHFEKTDPSIGSFRNPHSGTNQGT
jgi:hypothetical protein